MIAFAMSNAVQHLYSEDRVTSPLNEERARNLFLLVLSSNHLALLLNAGSLTGEVTEIVKFSATYLTTLVHLDAVAIGKIRSTPTVPDILRTVKRFLSPWPLILMTTPRYS